MSTTAARVPVFGRSLIARRIRRHITDELLEEPFEGDDPLAAGALDSLAIERLITYLQDRFEISFDDRELVRKNFSSIQALSALVQQKRRMTRRSSNG
jgi:acyl carrier protein